MNDVLFSGELDARLAVAVADFEQRAAQAGIEVRHRKDGTYVRCTDETLKYLTGPRQEILIGPFCTCLQRPYPHDLGIHQSLKRESYNAQKRFSWPWSLCLSERGEQS